MLKVEIIKIETQESLVTEQPIIEKPKRERKLSPRELKQFVSLMDELQKLPPNIPKLALVYGEHGLGKTNAIIWWATRNNAIYVRANNEMTQGGLLREM